MSILSKVVKNNFHYGELPVIGTVTWQRPVMVRIDEETPGQED